MYIESSCYHYEIALAIGEALSTSPAVISVVPQSHSLQIEVGDILTAIESPTSVSRQRAICKLVKQIYSKQLE
jgi:hypothetical protein